MGCDGQNGKMQIILHADFNPRTHMGCDEEGTLAHEIAALISIHAPTWGATKY